MWPRTNPDITFMKWLQDSARAPNHTAESRHWHDIRGYLLALCNDANVSRMLSQVLDFVLPLSFILDPYESRGGGAQGVKQRRRQLYVFTIDLGI